MADNILTSLWDGLSPTLIASFWEVDRHGNKIGNTTVKSPLSEGELEFSLNWQSPFENAGAESSFPSLTSMLQSGNLQPMVDIAGKLGLVNKETKTSLSAEIDNVTGRTGVTKLNSTQVFSGMPPVKFTLTVHFRAWRDPVEEVEIPLNQIIKWSLPKKLATNGSIIARLIDGASNDGAKGAADSVLPSLSPCLLAMNYKGRTYSPLVIESVGVPLTAPSDKNGNRVDVSIPLSISTLSAIDASDWDK